MNEIFQYRWVVELDGLHETPHTKRESNVFVGKVDKKIPYNGTPMASVQGAFYDTIKEMEKCGAIEGYVGFKNASMNWYGTQPLTYQNSMNKANLRNFEKDRWSQHRPRVSLPEEYGKDGYIDEPHHLYSDYKSYRNRGYCLTPHPITVLGQGGTTSLYRITRKLLIADMLTEADDAQKRAENHDPSLTKKFCDQWHIGDHTDARLVKVDKDSGKVDEGFEGMSERGQSEGNFWYINKNGFIRFRTNLPLR